MFFSKKAIVFIVLIALALQGGFVVAGIWFGQNYRWFNNENKNHTKKISSSQNQHTGLQRLDDKQKSFTSPLLDCVEQWPDEQNEEAQKMEKDLSAYIQTVKAEAKAEVVAVYYRDLNNGPWIGINEDEKFLPGSLLKVPLMISVYRRAQSDPQLLSQKLYYDKPALDLVTYYPPTKQLIPKTSYSVEELVGAAVRWSDNEAANLLLKNLSNQDLSDSYTQLGLSTPASDGISVKMYASFFRILYNASFLNRAYSEKALNHLSQTDFDWGIAAPLPKDIVVSHKFGEKGDSSTNIVQLHDCGVIYHPKRPYILCVMSRGNDFDTLAEIVRNVSSIVYKDVSGSVSAP